MLPSEQVLQSLSSAAEIADSQEIPAPVRDLEAQSVEELADTIAGALKKFERERAKLLDARLADLVGTVDRLSREVGDLSRQLQLTRSDGESLRLEFEASTRDDEVDESPRDPIEELRSQVATLAASVRVIFERVDVHSDALNGTGGNQGRGGQTRAAFAKSDAIGSEHLL